VDLIDHLSQENVALPVFNREVEPLSIYGKIGSARLAIRIGEAD